MRNPAAARGVARGRGGVSVYSQHARNPVVLAAILGIYFELGKLGLAVGGFNGATAAVWPASGFGLAVMVVLGPSVWPAVLAGAFLVHLTSTGQIAAGIAVAVGRTIESVLGAALVERFAGGAETFASARTIFRFTAIAAFASTPISATLGAVGIVLVGAAPWSSAVYVWMTWWLANLTGILVISPFVILLATTPLRMRRITELLEGLLLVALLAGVGLVVFAGRFPSDVQDYPLEFLCVPFLLWSAFRFGRRQTSGVLVVLSTIAVWGTLHGYGPFVRDSQNEALVLVQAYTSVMAVTGLVLASVVAEHKRAEAQLRELATTDPLTGLVNYRRLLEVLRTEMVRSRRTGRPFALLFLDMNGLKRINDKFGHLVGSRSLCRIADTLRRVARATDTTARFGGDEFAVVLPETDAAGAHVLLDRLHQRLASDADKPALSVSGGLAEFPRDGDTPTLLMRSADKALYEAKLRHAPARKNAAASPPRRTGTLF
jgi:diguanylate cyclase (GGDEF)-like protein